MVSCLIYTRKHGPFPQKNASVCNRKIRRAAVSSASNTVEGSARRSTREYLNFVNIAAGSAFETRYLVDLAARLGFMPTAKAAKLVAQYTVLAKSLVNLLNALDNQP